MKPNSNNERGDHGHASRNAVNADFDHQPVMVSEITDVFATVPAGVVLDATLGGAGHAAAILASRDDLAILGIDRDRDALTVASDRLANFGDRAMTYHGRFDQLADAMADNGIDGLSGALFDLGVSSPQLDRPERGFSYRATGPLDMRMDAEQTWSASDIVNGYGEAELARLIADYGDERFAKRIAASIVAARPIESTTDLADIVTAAIPAAARRSGGHPAKRTFQAIRIAVNSELDALPGALDEAMTRLETGGRLAVLSYHSGEDRIVKSKIRDASTGGCECPDSLPCVCDAVATVRIVRAPKQATAAEQQTNRRARSARLRVAEKIVPTASAAAGSFGRSDR